MGMEAAISPGISGDYVGAYKLHASRFNYEKLSVIPTLPAT